MEARVIIASVQKSNRSQYNVWAVRITGQEKVEAFCKSAYTAMKFMFLLKKRTGLNISENCLARLSQEIAAWKLAQKKGQLLENAANAQCDKLIEEAEKEQAEEKPKKQRKPRQKKNAKVVALG